MSNNHSQPFLILDKKTKSWNEAIYKVRTVTEEEASTHEKNGAKVIRMWGVPELPSGELIELPIWGLE